jgi:hypothetical protein
VHSSFKPVSIGTSLAVLAVFILTIVVLVQEPQQLQLLAFLLPVLVAWYLRSKSFSDARLSWQLPLVGYPLTFLIGAGMSASNRDIRTEVELVGAGVLMVFVVLGFTYAYKAFRHTRVERPPRWKKDALAGLACNLLLASLVSFLAHASFAAKHQPVPVGTTSIDRVTTA